MQCTHLADASIVWGSAGESRSAGQVSCESSHLGYGGVPGVQVFWDGHSEFWALTFRMLPLIIGVNCRVNCTVGETIR